MVDLIARPYNHPDVVTLTDEVQTYYRELYAGEGDKGPTDVTEFEAPNGHFVVGYVDGVPVAMGGWRRLGDRPGLPSPNTAELKRMYVAAAVRGHGLARVVLAELESSARAADIDWLVLETGRPQARAVALYTSAGYTEVDGTPFGYYTDHPDGIALGRSLG